MEQTRAAGKRIARGWFGLVLGSSLLTCCAQAAPRKEAPVVVDDDVTVRGDGGFVVAALPEARARLAAHGLALREPSEVVVHDEVHDFVMATGQTNPALRAWSTRRTVHLLPPSTWTDPSSTTERLAHELCHLALWQRFDAQRARRIPRFVAEGVCSVVAGQGGSRLDEAVVAARADAGAVVDFDDDPAYAYSYAAAVFSAYAACGGDLVKVVAATAGGADVAAAIGAPPRAFLDDGCPQVGGAGDQPAKVEPSGG